MKKQYSSVAPNKKQLYWTVLKKTKHPFLIFLFVLFFLFNINGAYSQAISIIWDNAAGCTEYSNPDRKLLLEEIEDSPCLYFCENSQVTFSLTDSSSAIASVNWVVAGGTYDPSSTGSVLHVTWGDAGDGTVQFTITYSDNSQEVKTICIKKVKAPKADFEIFPYATPEDYVGCKGQNITFTNTSTANNGTEIVSQIWEFSDGTFSSAHSPVHAFITPGNHWARLTVTNQCGCRNTFEVPLQINGESFEITCENVVCAGQLETYKVPIEVGSCTSPVLWSVIGGTIQGPANGSTVNVLWDNVGDEGFGYVSFDSNSCVVNCPNITTVKIPVIKGGTPISGPSTLCIDQQQLYKLPQWPATLFEWSINTNGGSNATLIDSDQRNEVIVQTNNGIGSFVLSCTYTNTLLGCRGISSILVYVNNGSVIIGPSQICAGSTSGFRLFEQEIQNNQLTGTWNLQGPNGISEVGLVAHHFNYTFTEPGVYTITAAPNSAFCVAESLKITVNAVPTAPMDTDIRIPENPLGTNNLNVCPNIPYNFVYNIPQNEFVYEWQVVGGAIQGANTGTLITVVFNNSGNYQVRLRAVQRTRPNCPSAWVTVTPQLIAPVLNITGETTVCHSIPISYSTNYTEGDVTTWEVFPAEAGSVISGNGTPNVEILWNKFTTTLVKSVRLRVIKCGVTFIEELGPITVLDSPTFTLQVVPSAVCKDEEFTFTIVPNPAEPLLNYTGIEWSFGGRSSIEPPNSTYSNFTYTSSYDFYSNVDLQLPLTVRILNPNGCLAPATTTVDVTVYATPEVIMSSTNNSYCTPPIATLITVNQTVGVNSVATIDWQQFDTFSNTWVSLGVPGNPSTYTATAFGSYRAVITTLHGCVSIPLYPIDVYQNCPTPGPGCTVPSSSGAITVTQTDCTSYAATLSYNPTPVTGGVSWSVNAPGAAYTTISNATDTGCDVTTNLVGKHLLTAQILLPGASSTDCFVYARTAYIIPYKPVLEIVPTCNPTAGNYTVILRSKSVVYGPIATQVVYEFFHNNQWHSLGNTNETTITLTPGTYDFKLRLNLTGYLSCVDEKLSFVLEALPNPSFTVSDTTLCPSIEAVFTPVDQHPDNRYLWEFDDASSNLATIPSKWYGNNTSDPRPFEPTLTITRNGCTVTSAPTPITVYPNRMEGEIDYAGINTNGVACERQSIYLEYDPINPINSNAVVDHRWFLGALNYENTLANPIFAPTTSGNYWVRVVNQQGCFQNITPGKNVTYIKAPLAEIDGPSVVCLNEPAFTLNGFAGGTNLVYRWEIDNVIVGTTPTLAQTVTSVGTIDYKLFVALPFPLGCWNRGDKSITVQAPPADPVISIDNINCDAYRINLSAQPGGGGTYVWSHGATGSSIEVQQGGAYEVTYIADSGCSSSAQLQLPKWSSYYNWVFPARGCYNLCSSYNPYLIGPYQAVKEFDWFQEQVSIASGTDQQVFNLGSLNGMYQLGLNTGLCYEKTDPTDIKVNECGDCVFSVDPDIAEFTQHETEDGQVYYTLSYKITNTASFAITLNLQSLNVAGVFVPANLVIPANTTSTVFTVDFYPYSGNAIDQLITNFILPGKCDQEVTTNLPSGAPRIASTALATRTYLVAAPNPTLTGTTVLYYGFDNSMTEKTLRVTDLTGRLLLATELSSNTGILDVDLTAHQSGIYWVTTYADGVLQTTTKIIKP
jgi:hypothetical protein